MDIPFFQLSLTLVFLLSYSFVKWMVHKVIYNLGRRKQVPVERIEHVSRYFKILFVFIVLIAIMMVWGVDYRGLFLFASSVLAVIGVALFAQWSILSNITAGVIVFFSFPAKIGDKVEIIDGSNSLKGTILEINIFQLLLEDDKQQKIIYPNSLILQRPIIKVLEVKPKNNQEKTSLFKQRELLKK